MSLIPFHQQSIKMLLNYQRFSFRSNSILLYDEYYEYQTLVMMVHQLYPNDHCRPILSL